MLAPTDSPYSIVDIFEKGGRPVIKNSNEVIVGKRGTKLPWILGSPNTKTERRWFTEKLIKASAILQQQGIKLNILHGGVQDDIVPVEVSKELAKQLDISFTQFPATNDKAVSGSAVHDFATASLRKYLINLIQQNLDLTK